MLWAWLKKHLVGDVDQGLGGLANLVRGSPSSHARHPQAPPREILVSDHEALEGYATLEIGDDISITGDVGFAEAIERWGTLRQTCAQALARKVADKWNALLSIRVNVTSFPDTKTVKIKAVATPARVEKE